MSQFPLARILDFISQVTPFDSLGEEEMKRLVARMEIAYFPRGEMIIQAGGEPSQTLHIIYSGSVKITVPTGSGEDILVDVRGERDMFGAVSLLQGSRALFSVTAQEDVLAFLLPGEDFKHLVNTYPQFQRHFSFSLARNIQATRQNVDGHLDRLTGTGSLRDMALQMRSRVGDLKSTSVLTCTPELSIRQAAQLMTGRRVGSVVILDPGGDPLGVLTDTDMRARVLATGLDPGTPVGEVMSRPPLTISHNAYAFEAMLEMARHGVHHLLVTEAGRMVGVISDHDIKVLTGSTPVGLVRDIENVSSFSELNKFPGRIQRVLEMLLRLGSSAEYMMDLLTEFLDRLNLKLFQIIENELRDEGRGIAPTGYCWLCLGPSGRREQAPPRFQDFAIVTGDVPFSREQDVFEYFAVFSRRVTDGLSKCGLTARTQGLGSDLRPWCRSAERWREVYQGLAAGQAPEQLTDLGLFFDFRVLQGDIGFAVSLRELVWHALSPDMLRRLAHEAIRPTPPIGFLRQSVVEKDGRYSDYLNLDQVALDPIAAIARILALEHRITETNTLGRLDELSRLEVLTDRQAADLSEAFSFVTSLKVSKYLEAHSGGFCFLDYIPVSGLNTVQRKTLKDSFTVIAQMQDLLRSRYGPMK